MGQHPSNWRRYPQQAPAGAWTALGIHLGDLFVSLAGQPSQVAARTASQIFPAPAEDLVSAEIDSAGGVRDRITCRRRRRSMDASHSFAIKAGTRFRRAAMWTKGIPSSFVHCGPDGKRATRSYDHANTVRLNFEAWADAIERRAPYRVSTEQLLANIGILDAITRSAAADGKPVML